MAGDREAYALELGRRIYELRAAMGLSQEKLAEAAGLHRNQISLLECGARDPRLSTIRSVAGALHVDASELVAYLD